MKFKNFNPTPYNLQITLRSMKPNFLKNKRFYAKIPAKTEAVHSDSEKFPKRNLNHLGRDEMAKS